MDSRCLIGLGLALALLLAESRADVPRELRQPGILYLGGNLPEPIILTLEQPVRGYVDRDFTSIAATFGKGTRLELVGVAPGAYLVSGTFRSNPTQCWVRIDEVPKVDPALIQRAAEAQRKADEIEAAIADKRVVEGMTFEQVRQSLGKPDEASYRTEVGRGRIDTWKYITYDLVPRVVYVPNPYGGVIAQTVYDKVPKGMLAVEFVGGLVVAIEEHVKASERSPGVTVPLQPVLPPPGN